MEVYNTSGQPTTLEELKQIVGNHSRDTYALKVTARKRFRELGYRNYVQMAEVLMELYIGSFRTPHPEGWFFKTYEWWLEQHGLGRRVVEHARRDLVELQIIQERHWKGNRVEYRLIPARALEVLYPEGAAENRESSTTANLDYESRLDYDRQTSSDHVGQSSSDHDRQTLRREDEEKKKSVGGSPAVSPPHNPSSQEQNPRDPNKPHTTVSRSNGSAATCEHPHDLADKALAILDEYLEVTDLRPMSRSYRSKARDELATLVSRHGTDMGKLRAVLRRMGERWESIHLTPLAAHEDAEARDYPAMDEEDWRRWRDEDEEPVEDTRRWEVTEWRGEPTVWVDGSRYMGGIPSNAPEWVCREFDRLECGGSPRHQEPSAHAEEGEVEIIGLDPTSRRL